MSEDYRLKIDGAFTPKTLPMERLALYMAAFAKVLGESHSVHFDVVEPGSAVLKAHVDDAAAPKVAERARRVRDGAGPRDAQQAAVEIDALLRRDNATGELTSSALIIPFPGRTRPEPITYGPFRQDGTLDGQLIRIGGKDETVPVHLRDGLVIHTGLYTTPALARELAVHFQGAMLRVHGTGTWMRQDDGVWLLRDFKIGSFEVLEETPLAEVVASLRAVKGSGWANVTDPLTEILASRHGEPH